MLNFFFPVKHRKGLPISLLKRIPILVNLNVILVFYFAFAAYTRYRADPIGSASFFHIVMVTNSAFLISLVLIRFKKYLAASSVSMVALLLESLWIGILLGTIGEGDLYRLVAYIVASSVLNSLLSIHKRQIILYAISGYLVILASTIITFIPRTGGFTPELRTTFITVTMVYIPVSIVFLLNSKLSNEIIQIAERELEKNKEKADSLDQLIQNAKGSMQIGKSLLEYNNETEKHSNAINIALETIKESSQMVAGESESAEEGNREILEFSQNMQNAVNNQNAFLEETSSSITQIVATIQNISGLAGQRKVGMDDILKKLHTQTNEINKVLEGFNKIREASSEVLSASKQILDVSEKTNLLAMNASIEAAHAGSSGSGFAVIAGEIRNLSNETQKSTHAIELALKKNDDVLKEAATTVEAYTTNAEDLMKEVHNTFDAIVEIINGMSEVSVGTNELIQATSSMMDVAHNTKNQVVEVTRQLTERTENLTRISEFSNELDEKLSNLAVDFSVIEGVLNKVRKIGDQNIHNIAELESDLDQINNS